VNTNQADFVADASALEQLLKRIESHRGGTVYYTPLGEGGA
jgi:hypothetical protein